MSFGSDASNQQKFQSRMLDIFAKRKYEPAKEIDLILEGNLDEYNTVGLNTRAEYTSIRDFLKASEADEARLVSDVDEELLLKIAFKEPANVTHVRIKATLPPVGMEDPSQPSEKNSSGPRLIRCFANLADLDFCDIDQVTAHQDIEASGEDIKGETKIPLPGKSFQRCQTIQILIAKNQKDTEFSFLNQLSLFGYTLAR